MLSATLREGLGRYDVGTKVRALRRERKMGLVELGRHTGLSAALLSKLERGKLFPTLPTLLRISLVFSVDLAYFFAGAREQPVLAVVRRRDRLRFPDRPGRGQHNFVFESLDFPATERPFNSYCAEFFPATAEALRRHDHAGVEFLYVLSGVLHVHVGPPKGKDTEHVLEAGDAMYFDSTQPHGYRRTGRGPCRALVITAG